MIDCRVHVEKKPDPKGDRVILTFEWVLSSIPLRALIPLFSGKFLPYIKW